MTLRPVFRVLLLLALLGGGLVPLHAQGTGAIRGRVVAAPDRGIAGAAVSLVGLSTPTATSDSLGAFLLTGVPAGQRLRVMATSADYSPGYATAQVAAGDTVTVTVRLNPPVDLPGLVATARGERRYTADSASTGAKIDVPLRDLPQTVTTITNAVIKDRNITETARLADNVSGVTPLVGYTGYGLNEQGYIIRGFATSYTSTTLRDGFRDFAGVGPRDLANVERVDFLKGPSSVLYGATGALGGIPNTVTKRPGRDLRLTSISASGDEDGLGRGELDLAGPLSADHAVRYRLVASGERYRNFRPFNGGAYTLSVSPSLEAELGSQTTLLLRGEYTRRAYRPDPYLPLDPLSFHLPADRYYGEPGFPLARAQGFVAQAELVHQFGPGVRLRQGLSVLGGRLRDEAAGIAGLDTLPDLLDRYAGVGYERSTDLSSQTELALEGRRFGVRHRALIGVELTREVYAIRFTNDGLAPISISRPVYGATRIIGDTARASHPENEFGAYVQDLVDLGAHVKVMAGARLDVNRTKQNAEWPALGLTGTIAKQNTTHLSPRAGLVYQPNGQLSLYAGWSRSFFPNLSTPGLDPTFPPEYGEQFEGGVREELAGGRFAANLAVYQITKRNKLEAIPNDSLGRSVLSGRQRSRGVEVDLQGNPVAGWTLVAAYSYTHAVQTKSVDPSLPNNQQLSGVPRHSASLWTSLAPQRGALHGLEVGGGLYLWSSHEATFPHTVRVPAWQRLDLMAAWDWARYRVQVNVDNVTDTRYFLGNYAGLARQAPRTVSAAVSAHL
ncbi:MAG: TonB-dependent receptor [Gemmatimonadales bacterium]